MQLPDFNPNETQLFVWQGNLKKDIQIKLVVIKIIIFSTIN